MSERSAARPGATGSLHAPASAPEPGGRPRSLADELRRWDDARLIELMRLRPDLMHPVPNDVAALAARATTTASTARALDGLDRWTLQVAEVVAALPICPEVGAGATVAESDVRHALAEVDGALVTEAIDRLARLALLWRDRTEPAAGESADDAGIYLTRTVRDVLGPYPCNLAAPSQGRIRLARYERTGVDPALLADAPPGALELLDRLTWGTPVGALTNADRKVSVESARTPVEWLLARDLLVADDSETVLLPRAVALHLRGGRLLAEPQPAPPAFGSGATRDPVVVDRTAGLHALTVVRHVDDLLEAWSIDPPDRLRAGGLGVRPTAAAAALIDVDVEAAVLVVELAATAGLLADDGEVWLPTPAFDVWRSWGTAAQWAHLVAVWLMTSRVPSLVGTRNPGLVNALTPEGARSGAPAARLEVLDELAEAGPGVVVDAAGLRRRLEWRTPRRNSELRSALMAATLREAEQLGVTGLGALASTGRALLALAHEPPGADAIRLPARGKLEPPPASLVASVSPWLPEPVRHVLLQADLTAVAPGPLEPELARRLALVADVESSGAGAVYRFSDSSVRRGLDAGLSRDDIIDQLISLSATGVPQPLEYLVADVARRHGGIRVGTASAYIRSDDVAALSEILADKRTAGLNPVRLAPTVLITSTPVDEALASLRAAGYAPAAESSDGRIVVRRKDSRRAPGSGFSLEAARGPGAPTSQLIDAAVRALRAGERAASDREAAARASTDAGAAAPTGSGLPRNSTAETVTALRVAVHAQLAIRIGYADTHGTSTERIVDPLQLQSGILTAYDHRAAEVRNFAVTRITGVEFIEESA